MTGGRLHLLPLLLSAVALLVAAADSHALGVAATEHTAAIDEGQGRQLRQLPGARRDTLLPRGEGE